MSIKTIFQNIHINCIKYLNVLIVFQNPNSPSKNWNFIALGFSQCVSSVEKIPQDAHCSFILGIN